MTLTIGITERYHLKEGNKIMFKKQKYTIKATNIVKLRESDSGPSNNLVRVNNRHMRHFRRWMPVCIKNENNGKWTIRYVVGASRISGLTLKALAIDYDAQVDLDIKSMSNVNLTLKKASFWQIQKWLLCTNDLNNRYGNYWGVLGTILGIIGIIGMF